MKRRKKWRICLLLLVFLFALFAFGSMPAAAEEEKADLSGNIDELLSQLDVDELEEYLNSLSADQREMFGGNFLDAVRAVLNGDFSLDYSNVLSAVAATVFEGLRGMMPAFCVICSIAILCGILTHFRSSFSENGTAKLIHFVGYSAILVLILSSVAGVLGDCLAAVNSMQAQMQAVFPVLLTLIATSGGSVSVAVYQPAVLFLSEAVVSIIASAVFPLAGLIFVLNMVGNMSKEIKVKNFAALFAGIIKWTLGITLAAFTVFLTVQGITSATYDGLSFKAAKYAISNSVPIVGGFIGSGFDLVIAGSVLIKNAVGSCGIALLVIVLAAPLIQLIVCNLFFKLAAAITEPVGDSGISDFLASVSGTVNYFIAGLVSVAFMYFITMLLLICSSNSLF